MVTQRETSEASAAPLVTITFQSTQGTSIVKHWYHVPRDGESVYVIGPLAPAEERLGLPEPVIAGRVAGVRWDSDGSVAIYVR